MLKGKAKADYQRKYMLDYMRNRRAGLNGTGLNKGKVLTDNTAGLNKADVRPDAVKAQPPKPAGMGQSQWNYICSKA